MRGATFFTLFLFLSAFVATSCQDYVFTPDPDNNDPTQIDARIEVTPEVLDFQQLGAGSSLTLEVIVTSVGADTLYLEDLFVEGPASFSVEAADEERILAPGSTAVVQVTYSPMTDEGATGLLHVLSNDRDTPDALVHLQGIGLAPRIQLDPATWDFGEHEIGCDLEQTVTIRNVGSAPLEIGEVFFAPTSDELVMGCYIGPGTLLDPGAMESVTVYYTPTDELPDTGYLHVYSNDPAQPDALATQFGAAYLAAEVVDEFAQEGNNWTDILWVVDNSGSMSGEQTSLALNFSSFLSIIEVLDIDYHIAVVTTDMSAFQGPVPVMTPSTPDVAAAFADAVQVGINGSGNEKGLQYGSGAVTPPLAIPGGPNDGFLREEAGLRVIFVSDEEDQSSDTVQAYVNLFQDLKVNPDHVVLSAITGQLTGCSGAGGNADPAHRYEQAVALTGGISESICMASWVNALSSLAWLSLSWQDTFQLSQDPVIETIEVELNHVPVYVGWDYDEVLGAVVFQPDYVPDTGDLISIRYNLLGDCSG
jgi:hypothetical protein